MRQKMHILVPTDLSSASKAGARFAVQWSQQQQHVHLVFVHVLALPRLTGWSDAQYEAFAAAERAYTQKKLQAFVAGVRRRLPVRGKDWSVLLLEGFSASITLMEYCRAHPEIRLVCMGTRGAGRAERLFGTNTGDLILHSDTPVIAVPASYRRSRLSRVVYATDLADCSHELRVVVDIARPLHAKVVVMHLRTKQELPLDAGMLQKVWEKEIHYPITVKFKDADKSLSLAENLEKAAGSLHPSMLALFSDRGRTALQVLLHPSKAERLAFDAKMPLLVMGKADR